MKYIIYMIILVEKLEVDKRTNLLSYNNLRHYYQNNYSFHRKRNDDQHIDHCDMEIARKHNLLAHSSSDDLLMLLLMLVLLL